MAPFAVNLAGVGTAVITTGAMPAPLPAHRRRVASETAIENDLVGSWVGCNSACALSYSGRLPAWRGREPPGSTGIEFAGGDRGRSKSDAVLVAGESVDLVVLGPGPV